MLLNWLDSPRGLRPTTCASDFWTCPQPPRLTQFAQKGCQLTGLEPRIPMVYLKFRRSGPVDFWREGPKNSGPPPPPPIGPIHIPIKSSRCGFQIYDFFYQNLCMPSKSYAYWRLLPERTFIRTFGIHTVFQAGNHHIYIRSHTVCIYGSGQPYTHCRGQIVPFATSPHTSSLCLHASYR